MNSPRRITIAGGGLSGLSLGLALCDAGIPVTLVEAGQYPRHRVCGEFLSGRGLGVLDRLGVLAKCHEAGAGVATTVRFATAHAIGPAQLLPHPALCLSRHRLDALLAAEFQRRGGELRTGERLPEALDAEARVHATGRRPAPAGGTWRWFGIKAHATGVPLEADLELHVTSDAYVGLCRIDGGRVNVCGLFRRRSGERAGLPSSPLEWLRGPDRSRLRERLQGAVFDPASLCTVGGLDLRRPRSLPSGTVRLGDAWAMIPPLTGNGMSIGLESADLACAPLADFARGRIPWRTACDEIRQRHDESFQQRLRVAGLVQRLLFLPVAPALMFHALRRSGWLWRSAFAATRG